MTKLPVAKIQKIKLALSQIDLTNLVLVLSQQSGDKLYLIYNREPIPTTLSSQHSVECLRPDLSLPDEFDGPIVGYASLDFMLPNLPTHGVNFYPIRRMMDALNKRDLFYKNGHRLAITMLDYLERLPASEKAKRLPHGRAKVVRLALPYLLNGRSLQNLLAIVPTGGLREFIDSRTPGFNLVYQSDATKLAGLLPQFTESNWLVGFEELSALFPQLPIAKNGHAIKLRPILQNMGCHTALETTCRDLATACWQEWESQEDSACRAVAYYLAAESWLLHEDTTDLVALFPHRDFSHFSQTGTALRVYRVPQIKGPTTKQGPQVSLGDLVKRDVPTGSFTTHPIAFHVLRPVLSHISGGEVLDLGVLLWRSGNRTDLARTLWLLSSDLLHLPSPNWNVIEAQPADITSMALQAVQIYSLLDPWQWRQGRFQHFLHACYQHLVDCLLNQEAAADNETTALFYQMLRRWYGCYLTDDMMGSLGGMINTGRQFQLQTGSRTASPLMEIASIMTNLGDTLVRGTGLNQMLFDGREKRPFQVATYIRAAINQEVNVLMPSFPFMQWLQSYQKLHARWLQIQNSLGAEKPAFHILSDLRQELNNLHQIIYAPAHEEAILQWAIKEDMDRIDRLIQAVETGPIIKIDVRNPWLNHGFRDRVRLDVENVGGATAFRLHVEIKRSRQVDLIREPANMRLDAFLPGQRQQLFWEIQARETAVTLQVVYRYVDHQGQSHTHQEDIPINVTKAHSGQLKSVGNLYQAGPPVSGWGRFFGRREELDQIITRLIGGITQPILLRGPRRMGKTSILRQLEWLLRNNNQQLRTLGLKPQQEIQLNSCVPIFQTLQSINNPEDTAEFFQTIYEDICDELGLLYDGDTLSKSFRRSPTRAFMKQMAHVFDQRPFIRPLVIIDEWDELYRPAYNKMAQNLRSLMEGEVRINWLVSSTWTLSEEAGRYGSPFYNQAYTIELKEMDWQPAVELVTAPGERMGVSWRGEAVVAMLDQTGRRPYLIQLACSKLTDYLRQRRENIVSAEAINVVTEKIIQEAQATAQYFGFLWRDDQTDSKDGVNWMGKLILWVIDDHYPQAMTRTEIRQAIEDAFRMRSLPMLDRLTFNREFNDQITQLQLIFDALTVTGDRYSFSVPLVQRWLRRVISQQVDPVPQAYLGLRQLQR